MKNATSLFILLLSAMMLLLTSCTKTRTEEYVIRAGEYYPYKKGNIRDYEFDSTSYDWLTGKPLRYKWLVRETVTDTFRDLEGDLAMRLEQYRSTDTGKSYWFYALHTLKATSAGLERVEDNQRYLRLSIPIADKKRWNGNAYNGLGAQEYRYIGVSKPYVNPWYDFPDCVFVSMQDDSTFISVDRHAQIYARNVGMVYRLDQQVKYNNTGEPQGHRVEWKLRKYWEK